MQPGLLISIQHEFELIVRWINLQQVFVSAEGCHLTNISICALIQKIVCAS
jgi:hypothetical protein